MIRITNLHGYERDTPFIEVHDQPSILIDLALSREIDSHALLRGSQLFLEDMLTARKKIAPSQLLVMIANLRKHYRADDSSFLFGQRILPGYYGSVSQLLTHSLNLSEAINSLCQFHAILTPLLTPRYFESDSHLFIYWLDNCGSGDAQSFLVETYMTAVYAMTNWLSQEKLPWKFSFTFEEPRYVEQYWVHLNDQLHFNQQMNTMSISKDYLYKSWPNSAPVSQKMAENNALIQINKLGLEKSFLDALYDYLKKNIQQNLYLEDVAEAFGMSAATFKRKLLKHDTHFQAQLDLARKHVALYLFQIKGYQHHQVAEYLRFNDMNNFRRAFKRWTGFSLAELNEHCY
jgi:AraC-like DNA-binding protein